MKESPTQPIIGDRNKEYPVLSQKGYITFDQQIPPEVRLIDATFGIQIAADGRIWICVNGQSIIRFRPKLKGGD